MSFYDERNVFAIMTIEANVTNFTEFASLVRVPASGQYDFIIRGVTRAGDRCMFVDGVSMKRVVLASETPALPKGMALNVASGAKLKLDFTGTNRVDRIRLGGHTVTGVISAETHPNFISGLGALYAEPKSLSIFVR